MAHADPLDQILGDYRARKAVEREAREAEEAAKRDARTRRAERLVQEGMPVLESIAGRLRAEGHEAESSQNESSVASRYVCLSFTPQDPEEQSAPSRPSKLTIRCEDTGTLSGKWDISTATGPAQSYRARAELREGDEQPVGDWIREQALSFVREVLRVN